MKMLLDVKCWADGNASYLNDILISCDILKVFKAGKQLENLNLPAMVFCHFQFQPIFVLWAVNFLLVCQTLTKTRNDRNRMGKFLIYVHQRAKFYRFSSKLELKFVFGMNSLPAGCQHRVGILPWTFFSFFFHSENVCFECQPNRCSIFFPLSKKLLKCGQENGRQFFFSLSLCLLLVESFTSFRGHKLCHFWWG